MFWKKKKKPAPTAREKAVEQAKQALTAKREEIGDETLNEIRNAIMKKENSPIKQSIRQINAADTDKVIDHLTLMLRDK